MVKRKYPGAYYPVSKRGRYTRRRRTRRRTAYRGRRRTYRRSIMSGVGEVKTIHAQENFTLRSSEPAERVENWDIVPINTMARGSANNQRVGNVIGPCVLQYRYAIDIDNGGGIPPTNDLATYVRVILVQLKGTNWVTPATPGAALPDAQDLFDQLANGPYAHLMTFKDGVTSFCRILYDKVHHMDYQSSTSSTFKRLRFNIPSLRWAYDTDPTYASNPILAYFIASQGSTATDGAFVHIQAEATLRYKDC